MNLVTPKLCKSCITKETRKCTLKIGQKSELLFCPHAKMRRYYFKKVHGHPKKNIVP